MARFVDGDEANILDGKVTDESGTSKQHTDGAAHASDTRSGMGPSDAALVVAARAGEPWATEALFRRYAPMVNRLAYRLAPWPSEADDLAQDAFIQALKGLDKLKDPQAFAGWLKRIVFFTATKKIRRHRLRVRLGLASSEPLDLDRVVSPNAPPEAAAELRAIYEHINEFPAQERIALILKRVEGMTIKEVAEQLGVSEGTAKRRLRAAEERVEAWRNGRG